MEIFKIKPEDEGKIFIVRPLLNNKRLNTLKDNIVSYKWGFNSLTKEWSYRHLCFALVNEELKIFDFSKEIYKLFSIDGIPEKFLFMSNDKAIKITVGVKMGFLNNKYEILTDEKYRFDDSEEKRSYILNLLDNTKLDLLEALSETKENLLSKLLIEKENISVKF